MEKTLKPFSISLVHVLIYLHLNAGYSELITVPHDTEVLFNHSTYFNCSTSIVSKQIHWYHYPVGENKRNYVYYQGPSKNEIYRDRYSVAIGTGVYDLIIRSVQPGDAGRYVCQDDGGLGSQGSAELIVLDHGPVCESSMTPGGLNGPKSCGLSIEELKLSCSLSYSGNIYPTLQWKMDGNDTPISDGITIDNSVKTVKVNLTKGPEVELNHASFTCGTTGSHDRISSCQVKVNYAIEEPEILNVTKGETVSCAANTNVPCTFRWIYGNDTVCPASCSHVLTTNLLEEHSCEASCTIDGISCTFVAMRIFVMENETQSPEQRGNSNCKPYEIAIVCICVLLLLLSITVAVLIVKPRCTRRLKLKGFKMSSLKRPTKNTKDEKQKLTTAKGIELNETQPEATDVEKPLISIQSADELNKAQIKSLRTKILKSKAKNDSLQLENDQLQSKVKQQMYLQESVKYADKPSSPFEIQLKEKTPINGITTLGDKLFVVTKSCHEIQIYDSKTYKPEKSWMVKELTEPVDIASSKAKNYLYIFCIGAGSKVVRLNSGGKIQTHWPAYGGKGRLSTYESNVILCHLDKQSIYEYSEDGELILQVNLSTEAFLNNPLHVIKVTSTFFLVSHGDVKDKLHRVCLVDLGGNVKNEYKDLEKSRFASLIDDEKGSIVVADEANTRILLLSSRLTYQRTLIELKQESKGVPVRMCFDDTQKQIFVAVNKWSSDKSCNDCRIMIFNTVDSDDDISV